MADRVGRVVAAAGVVAGATLVALVRRRRPPRHVDRAAVGPAPAPSPTPGTRAGAHRAAVLPSVDLPPPADEVFPPVDTLFPPGARRGGPHALVVPPAPVLVAFAFDDAVPRMHGPDHARGRRRRRARRSAGTAVRVTSGVMGTACLAAAAVLVLQSPGVDVGEVDLAPVAAPGETAGSTPDAAGATPGPPTAPARREAVTAPAASSSPTASSRSSVPPPSTSPPTTSPSTESAATADSTTGATSNGRSGADPAVDPAPGVVPTEPTPSAAPTPAVDVGVASGRVTDLPVAAARPTRLRLPSLDLDVPVVHVGQDDEGRMDVPADVDDAGWYEFGPAPGEEGNAVVAGHVDSREQGLGAFHRLVDLAVGDRIAVDADDGTTSTWEVTGRALLDKSGLDTTSLFRRSGPAQLVLVTCGGNFDRTIRSYDSNLVVVAVRIGR